jgi:hypothetical protein
MKRANVSYIFPILNLTKIPIILNMFAKPGDSMKHQPRYFSCSRSVLTGFAVFYLTILLLNKPLSAQKRITEEPRPKWVDTMMPGMFVGVSHRYPDESDARADALADAKRQIIETLGGIIESEFVDQIIEKSGAVTTTDAFTNSRIKVVSRNIIAVKPSKVFVEQWRVKEGMKSHIEYQVFMAVPFSEEDHRQFMKEMVDETIKLGDSRFDESLALAKQGQISMAIEQMKTVQANVQPLLNVTGLLPADIGLLNGFKEKVATAMDKIPASIRIEGTGAAQKAKMGLKLPQPLELKVCWIDGDQRYPLPNLDVNISVVKGKATLAVVPKTDANGKVIIGVEDIASAGKIEILAQVQFPEGIRVANNQYTFTLLPDNKVIVKILESNLGQVVGISYLENTLLKKLTFSGFKVLENNPFGELTEMELNANQPEIIFDMVKDTGADLILLGCVSSGQTNKIQEGFYFARAQGTLKVYNVQQKSVVGNYIVEDKDAGNSEENAGLKSRKPVIS